MRLAFEQFLAGPNTVDEDRDDFARKGAAVLLACYDDAAGRAAARADDLHVYAAASLLGCTGWILGQQLGCVCCGVLGGHDDVKRDLAPLIPKLSRLLNEVQASPEINLAAKLALDAMCSVGAAGAFDANSHFLATHLDDAGLLGVLARDPERDEREIFRVPTRAAKGCEIPNFKGSYLGRFSLVSADFWTSDHLSERSRSVDAFHGTLARGTPTLKRR